MATNKQATKGKPDRAPLSEQDRVALLRSLIADLDGPADTDADTAWLDEAARRDQELESGAVASIPPGYLISARPCRL
jgi:putative addiction module component